MKDQNNIENEVFIVVEKQAFSGNMSIFSAHSTKEDAEEIAKRLQKDTDKAVKQLNEGRSYFHGSDFFVITGEEYDENPREYGFVPSTDKLSLSKALQLD